jgi:DNA mismatch repair protein MutH
VGHLVERALGASAGSRAVPDFEALGIELKTLPVDLTGRPRESTFVCTITLAELLTVEWQASRVRHKLSRVLWVPVESAKDMLLAGRRFGTPLFWSPNDEELSALRFDWEELTGLVAQRGLDAVTAHIGRCLQIRPKARDSRARRRGEDSDGVPLAVMPRGFYLRSTFTEAILQRYFALPPRLRTATS